MDDTRFLHFEGELWENMIFESRPGWETRHVTHFPDIEESDYVLELRDVEGQLLVDVLVDVDFSHASPSVRDEMISTRVIAYLPFREDGRMIVFRRGDRVLFRDEVPAEPPEVGDVAVEISKSGKATLTWEAATSTDRTLTFNVGCVVDGRAFVVARDVRRRRISVDLGMLPGGDDAVLTVQASDGVRSATAMSKSFRIEEKVPAVWMQTPAPGQTVPPLQPLTLSGQALDSAGRSLPADGLEWLIDDQVVATGTKLAAVADLEPGRHQVTLRYGRQEAVATITVARPTEAQRRMLEMIGDEPTAE